MLPDLVGGGGSTIYQGRTSQFVVFEMGGGFAMATMIGGLLGVRLYVGEAWLTETIIRFFIRILPKW